MAMQNIHPAAGTKMLDKLAILQNTINTALVLREVHVRLEWADVMLVSLLGDSVRRLPAMDAAAECVFLNPVLASTLVAEAKTNLLSAMARYDLGQ